MEAGSGIEQMDDKSVSNEGKHTARCRCFRGSATNLFISVVTVDTQAGERVKTKENESVHVTLSTVAALCLCKTWRYCNSSQNADKSSGRNFNSTLDLNIWNIMNEGERLESRMQLFL